MQSEVIRGPVGADGTPMDTASPSSLPSSSSASSLAGVHEVSLVVHNCKYYDVLTRCGWTCGSQTQRDFYPSLFRSPPPSGRMPLPSCLSSAANMVLCGSMSSRSMALRWALRGAWHGGTRAAPSGWPGGWRLGEMSKSSFQTQIMEIEV